MEDIWIEIMLNSDPYTIINLSHVLKLQTDNHFWKMKFEKDQLPIFGDPKTLREWVQEYNNIETAQQRALDYLQCIKNESIVVDTYYVKYQSLNLTQSILNQLSLYDKIKIEFYDNHYHLSCRLLDCFLSTMTLDRKSLLLLLTYFIYSNVL